MSAPLLFSNFKPVSTESWESAIREDLKGAEYPGRLIWHAPEGFDVKAFYRAEDLASLGSSESRPGDFPYVRGTGRDGDWRIREEIDASDPDEANRAAVSAVAGGAEEIAFCQVELAGASDLAVLLANLEKVPVRFERSDRVAVHLLTDHLRRRPCRVKYSAGLDWTMHLEWWAALSADTLSLVPFAIGTEELQERGATAVEEVGMALASGIDFVGQIELCGVPACRAAGLLSFTFAMGPEFFMQAAKLRAFRLLWAQALASFGVAPEDAKARIYARTSRLNRTIGDPHTNILRGTTEAISAVLGGAESICVAPFDQTFKAPDVMSRRLARNTQLVLKAEAHFARVADPGGGSYYLEALTDLIATRAWKFMQEIEANGGYRRAAGSIVHGLEQRRQARERN